MAFTSHLTEDEKRLLAKYESQDYNTLYEKNDESTLYNTAKTLRKVNEYPTAKIKDNDPRTYSNFISTKPKTGSPSASLQNGYTNWLVKQQSFSKETINSMENKSLLDKTKDKTAWALKTTSDYTLKPALKTGARVLDAPGTAIARGFYGVGALGGAVYYQAEELKNSIVEKRDFDWMKGAEKWEDNLKTVEYVYGGKLDTGDILDFRTRDEKRKELIKDLPMTERKRMEDELGNIAMLSDISSSIMSGVGISNALKGLSNAGKVATALSQTGKATQLSTKALPTVGKIATVLEKTINPSLNNMAKLGVVTTALALPYYGLTGKWIFGDDQGATEGAGIVIGSLGLKGLGKAGGAGYDYIKKLMGDADFQKGVEMFKNKSKELFPESKKITEIPTDERKSIYKSISELVGQNNLKKEGIPNMKDTSDFHPKGDNIKSLLDKGVLKEDGITLNKKGEEILGFTYTDSGKQFLPKTLKSQVENGKKIGFHYPKKLWDETINIKTEQPKIDTEKIQTIKQLQIDSLVNKSKKIDKFKDKIQKTSYWDYKKSDIHNYFNYIKDNTLGLFVNNENKRLARLLGDKGMNFLTLKGADKTIQRKLSATMFQGRVEAVKENVMKIQSIAGNDFAEFNTYLFNKSRYFKTISENKKGKELLTSYADKNGNRIKITADELKSLYEEGESKFARLGDDLHRINKEVLEYEKAVGIRTEEEVDNFLKANPYYIPDRLEDDVLSTFIEKKDIKIEKMKIGNKSLKGGTVDFDFDKRSVDNLYKQMQYRIIQAGKNEKIVNSLELAGDSGIIRVAKKGDTLKKGEEGISAYIDGKKEIVIMPKVYKEALERDDTLIQGTLAKALSFPTMVEKFWFTGRGNPLFQLKSPMWEIPGGIMKALSTNGIKGVNEYVKALAGHRIYETEAGKDAMYGLLKSMGGDFSYVRYLEKEYLTKEKTFLKKAGNIQVFKEKHPIAGKILTLDIGHDIEQFTLRFPLFQQDLKLQGLTKEKVEKLAIKAGYDGMGGGSGVKFEKLLKENGFDLKRSGHIARSVFDYSVAKKQIRNLSKLYGYTNILVSGATAFKEVVEENPKAFLGLAGLAYMYSDITASYNYGVKNMFGLGSDDPEKREIMMNQNDYVKHKVGFVTVDNDRGKIEIEEVGRNIPLIEWMYPLVAESKMNGGDIEFTKAFNKMFKDFTYFGDLEKRFFLDVGKLTPKLIKPVTEIAFNKDFFYDTELIPDKIKMKEIKSEEYTKHTKLIYIKLARALSILGGGEVQDNGIIEGGRQFSPIELEKLSEYLDPSKTISRTLSSLIATFEKSKGMDTENNEKLINIFSKEYNIKTSDDRLFEEKETTDYERLLSNNIKVSIGNTKTPEELDKVARDLVEQYGNLPEFEGKKRTFENAMKKQLITFEYGKDAYWEYNSTAKDLASYYYSVLTEDGVDAFNKKIKVIMKMHEDGLYSDKKFNSLQEEIGKLMEQ